MKKRKTVDRTFLTFVIAIFVIAFLLRIIGIYPGYPNNHPDEGSSYHTTVYMFYNFLHPDRFDYPAGVPFLNLLIYTSVFLPPVVAQILFQNPFALLGDTDFFTQHKEIIFGPWNLNAMFWTRGITAVFGTGSIVFTYFAAKNLFNKYVGLFSAFFLAVNYLHVVRSHFGLPDAYNSFFLALMLFICSKLLVKDTLKMYLLAGFVGGMAFALKYQIFAFLPFFLVHFFIVWKKKKPLLLFRKEFILSGIVAVLTFLALNPYYLLNIADAMRQNANDVRRYQMGSFFLRPYSYYYLFNWGIGQLSSIAVVLGIIFMFVRSPRNWFVLMSFVFPFFFFMTYYSQGGIFTRNFANVMPYLMIFAGFFAWIVYSVFQRFGRFKSVIFMMILLIFVNFHSIKNSLMLDFYYSQPWNVDELSQWLESTLPKNVTVRFYQLFLTQKGTDAFLNKNITQKDWDYSKGPNSLAEFQEEGTDFAILNTNPLQAITYWWRGYPELYLKDSELPFDYIENAFHGLLVKELSQYTVFEAYKPWQSHYENNYIVYKIPQKPKEIGKKIKSFSFDNKKDMWKSRGEFGFGSMDAHWTQDFGGSIIATSSGTLSRLGSPAILITEGMFYTVRGKIKTTAFQDGERDGFLRIDFYKDRREEILDTIGVSVAISQRAFVNNEWAKVQTSLVAPKGTKFMTVSFQFKNAYYSSMIDDIEVFEYKIKPLERFKEVPYVNSTIPIESLYYNTFI